jgi:hypothetical protein
MDAVLVAPFAVAALAAAGYAQYRVSFHTTSRGRALVLRLLLGGVGIAFGTVNAIAYGAFLPPPLLFALSFGIVHVPAAIILELKRRRGR